MKGVLAKRGAVLHKTLLYLLKDSALHANVRAIVQVAALGALEPDEFTIGCLLGHGRSPVSFGDMCPVRENHGRARAGPAMESTQLLDDLGHNAGTDGTTAFANCEANAFFHRHALAFKVDFKLDVVTGHAHFGAAGQRELAGDVGGAEVELGLVPGEERCVSTALFLGQDIDLCLEAGVRLDAAGLANHLAALDVILFNTTEQATDVVAGLAFFEGLLEHLNTSDGCLADLGSETNDFRSISDLHDATLDTASSDSAAALDREDIFD